MTSFHLFEIKNINRKPENSLTPRYYHDNKYETLTCVAEVIQLHCKTCTVRILACVFWAEIES